MAQASGGTAGTSSQHGDGGMSSGAGGGLGGGLGGSNGGSNQSGNNGGQSSSMGGALGGSVSKAAASTAAADSSKKTGGIMSGLMSSVASARAPSATPGTVGGFGQTAGGKAAGAASGAGYGNATAGSVSNAVGAMNTPQAQEKGRQMGVAERQGFRDTANAGLTESAFGAAGLPGAAVGKAITAGTMANPYGETDEGRAYSAGQKLAGQEGLGSVAKGAANLLGGVLGGPIGGMLMNALTSAASYGMQRGYHPSAFDSSMTPSTDRSAGAGLSAPSGPAGNGGARPATPANMASALSTPAPASVFEGAGDFDRGSYQKLGLTDILK